MLAAIIDNGSTWLFDIHDNLEIDGNILFNYHNKDRYIGWLVNSDNMFNIVSQMPISRFMLNNPVTKQVEDITVEEANIIYQGLVNLRQKKKIKSQKE